MRRVVRKPPSSVARALLRLPADLHRQLAAMAATDGLSFNEFCVRRLRAPAGPHEMSAVRSVVVHRAQSLFGARLIGVIVLGSWARGEASAGSDLDVLVVIDAGTPLTRDLYRAWDREPLACEGRVVDAHFTHLQAAGTTPTAVWCEAAVDGIVWYDRDGEILNRLGEARRAIADRRVMRSVAHGHPYWKGVA
jgi:predicted nucleotidyltransferase